MPVIIDLTACSDTLLPFTQPPVTSEITAVEVSDDDSEDDAIHIPAHDVVVLPTVDPIAPAA